MLYSFQSGDDIFIKGYGFLYFAKNMVKNVGSNVSKILSDTHSQKPFEHARESATDALKTTSK